MGKVRIDVSFADFFGNCSRVISEDRSQILKSCWIRPEDTRNYSEITSFFKIVDRGQPRSFVIRATKAYLEESWDGDLLDIVSCGSKRFGLNYGAYLDNKSLDKYKFFETVTSCDKNCRRCGYCEELARKLIELGVFTPEKGEDMAFKDVVDRLRSIGELP